MTVFKTSVFSKLLYILPNLAASNEDVVLKSLPDITSAYFYSQAGPMDFNGALLQSQLNVQHWEAESLI